MEEKRLLIQYEFEGLCELPMVERDSLPPLPCLEMYTKVSSL